MTAGLIAAFIAGANLVWGLSKYFLSADGFQESKNRREGEQLALEATVALRTWRKNPTDANWNIYKEAENALVAWSNAP